MHLADAFIQSDLQLAFRLNIFISMCVPWESNPQPFALVTQCSTTELQEHYMHFRAYFMLYFYYYYHYYETATVPQLGKNEKKWLREEKKGTFLIGMHRSDTQNRYRLRSFSADRVSVRRDWSKSDAVRILFFIVVVKPHESQKNIIKHHKVFVHYISSVLKLFHS